MPPPANGGGRQYWNTYAYRTRLDYEFSPAATLSYIGGYRYFEVDPKSTGSLPVVYANVVEQNETTTQSHELRLAGDVNGIVYQVGAFLFKQQIDQLAGFYLGDITPGTQNFGLFINYNLRDSEARREDDRRGRQPVDPPRLRVVLSILRFTHEVGLAGAPGAMSTRPRYRRVTCPADRRHRLRVGVQ